MCNGVDPAPQHKRKMTPPTGYRRDWYDKSWKNRLFRLGILMLLPQTILSEKKLWAFVLLPLVLMPVAQDLVVLPAIYARNDSLGLPALPHMVTLAASTSGVWNLTGALCFSLLKDSSNCIQLHSLLAVGNLIAGIQRMRTFICPCIHVAHLSTMAMNLLFCLFHFLGACAFLPLVFIEYPNI